VSPIFSAIRDSIKMHPVSADILEAQCRMGTHGSTFTGESMSGSWRCLAALTLARAAMGFQFQSIAAVAPLIGDGLALDKAQLGWLIGLYLLPGVVFALPGGLLGRRFGDKRLVLVGLALMAAGGAWLTVAESFAAANAARFTSGIGAVVLNVLMTKMVTDLFEGRDRFLAMSVLINAWPIGIGVSLAVGGALGEIAGWRWSVASAAVFALLGLVVVATFYRPPLAVTGSASPSPAATGIGVGALTRREWSLLAIAALPWLLYNAAYQIVLSFLPSFLVENGSGIADAGWLVALNTVMFVVSVQAGGFLLERSRRPDRLCHATILAWCASLLFIAAGSAPLPWLLLGGLVGGIPAAALVSAPGEVPATGEPKRRDGRLLHRLLPGLRGPADAGRRAVRRIRRQGSAVDGSGGCLPRQRDVPRIPARDGGTRGVALSRSSGRCRPRRHGVSSPASWRCRTRHAGGRCPRASGARRCRSRASSPGSCSIAVATEPSCADPVPLREPSAPARA
jgi:predicted MFS family arabinose efflux permease